MNNLQNNLFVGNCLVDGEKGISAPLDSALN